MRDSKSKIELIYNGEIYNFKELKQDLEDDGIGFKSNSDTEVIVYLYLRYGHEMLKMLNGIFSIAIWDKSKKEIFLARDNLGVKPLYYINDDDIFAFSSEMKAIMDFSQKSLSLDYESLAKYLTFLWCPGNGTPVSSIKKVEPGEYLRIKEGKVIESKKWYSANYLEKKYKTKAKCIQDLDTVLRSSVHRQMMSDVEVGAFLSGGLDSSSVVNFATEVNPSIKCFTIKSDYEDGVEEDLPYARQVADHLNVPLIEVNVTPDMMVEGIEEMVIQLDEPLADIAPLNVKFISETARDMDIKVLLSGAGGDDVFTGYRRHTALSLDRYLKIFPKSLMSSMENLSSRMDSRLPSLRKLSKFLDGSRLQGDERIINYFIWTSRSDLIKLFSKDASFIAKEADPLVPMRQHLSQLEATDDLDRMLSLEQRFFLTDHNLLYTDKMSMAKGVEVRVPLLDKELLDFSRKIPNKWKQKGFTGKWILKKTMESYLPKNVIYRPKSGFGVPLRSWIRNELKEFIGDTLSEEAIHKRGIFETSAVKNIIAENEKGSIDASYTILSLICIEIWCKNFLDKPKFN